MALTLNRPSRATELSRQYPFLQWRFVQATCDNSYPTGGYTFSAADQCGFTPQRVLALPYGAYFCECDLATDRLLVYKGGNEVGNGTDLSSVSFLLMLMRFLGWSGASVAPTSAIQAGAGAVTTEFRANPATAVADGTTSIDVTGANEFSINNTSATTITAFTGMVDGQYVNLNFEDDGNTILQHNTLIRLKDRENFRARAGARVTLWYNGTYFREAS